MFSCKRDFCEDAARAFRPPPAIPIFSRNVRCWSSSPSSCRLPSEVAHFQSALIGSTVFIAALSNSSISIKSRWRPASRFISSNVPSETTRANKPEQTSSVVAAAYSLVKSNGSQTKISIPCPLMLIAPELQSDPSFVATPILSCFRICEALGLWGYAG